MIIEYDKNDNEIGRWERFSAEDIEEFYIEFGKDNTNKFLDSLNLYGEAHLRPDDPDDNGRFFVEEKEE